LYTVFHIYPLPVARFCLIVYGFSHLSATCGTFPPHCIWFFTFICYLWHVSTALYMVFHIYPLPVARFCRIVYGFSHLSAPCGTFPPHCIWFFTFICYLWHVSAALYMVFHIYPLPVARFCLIVYGFSHLSAACGTFLQYCI